MKIPGLGVEIERYDTPVIIRGCVNVKCEYMQDNQLIFGICIWINYSIDQISLFSNFKNFEKVKIHKTISANVYW